MSLHLVRTLHPSLDKTALQNQHGLNGLVMHRMAVATGVNIKIIASANGELTHLWSNIVAAANNCRQPLARFPAVRHNPHMAVIASAIQLEGDRSRLITWSLYTNQCTLAGRHCCEILQPRVCRCHKTVCAWATGLSSYDLDAFAIISLAQKHFQCLRLVLFHLQTPFVMQMRPKRKSML